MKNKRKFVTYLYCLIRYITLRCCCLPNEGYEYLKKLANTINYIRRKYLASGMLRQFILIQVYRLG